MATETKDDEVETLLRKDDGPATYGYASFNLIGCLQTVARGVGYLALTMAAMGLVAAVIIFFVQRKSISSSDHLTGVVNEIRFLDSGEGAPVVLYEWHGGKHLYESPHYSDPPDYAVGEVVPLFVNREHPEDITLDTFTDRWALIVGLAVIGSALALISIVFLYFGRRKF